MKLDKKYLLSGGIILAGVLWLLTGLLSNDDEHSATEPGGLVQDDAPSVAAIFLVRGVHSIAETQTLYLDVPSQTLASRTVQVKAEISGKIVALPGEQGTEVQQGDLLCRIAIDARQDEYNQAQAALISAQIEYAGFVDLNKKGLQSEVLLARSKAMLEQARTQAKKAELALANTQLLAPFDGVVTSQEVEVGDFLAPGARCVSLMELDPLLVTAQVAEKNISRMVLGDEVAITLLTGEAYSGTLSFIGHAPDLATRTYPIEVTIANPGMTIRAGLTAKMRVPVGVDRVHLISPASLVLNNIGTLGVRVMDDRHRVRFMAVEVIGESPAGILVKGLPKEVDLITVGQEEVVEGQQIEMEYTSLTLVHHP